MPSRPHSEDCRRRLHEEMRKTEQLRNMLGRADDKINADMGEEEKQREDDENQNDKS